jgi:hypothetical protein
MNFKKIGQLASIANSSCFHAIPSKALLIQVVYKTSKKDKGKHQHTTELTFYKAFTLVKVISFDTVGVLSKFRDQQTDLVFTTADKLYLININTFERTEQAFKGQITAKIDDYYLIDGRILKQLHSDYQLQLEKKVYLNLHYHIEVPNHYIYGYDKVRNQTSGLIDATSIECFSLQTGKSLWHYEHSSEISFIGNTEKQLWLILSNQQVCVLDIQTGKPLAWIGSEDWNQTKSVSEAAVHSIVGRCHLDKNKVIALGEQFYQEISMKTFQFKQVDLKAELDKYAISAMYACYDKKYIYFYDSNWMNEQPRGKVAILDRKTLKVVWCWDIFKELGTAPLHIEVVENQFYVLDNGLTLHVFEFSNSL